MPGTSGGRNTNSSYGHYLPLAFPWVMTVPQEGVAVILAVLASASRPLWSSFAVTMENWDGTVNIWLSQVSYDYLKEQTLAPLADLVQPTTDTIRE